MDLFDLFLLSSVLHKHMDGVTNDVERSNEMVSFIILTAINWLPPCLLTILNWQLLQVAILQEELEAKDLEVGRLRETLSQKEATENRAVEEREEAGNGLNTASDPLQVKVES
jgi:hypothetical protein